MNPITVTLTPNQADNVRVALMSYIVEYKCALTKVLHGTAARKEYTEQIKECQSVINLIREEQGK
jgi:hypothetical protein